MTDMVSRGASATDKRATEQGAEQGAPTRQDDLRGQEGRTDPKRVIVDFDNTMGLPGCDVDDGLALLYLLGCDNIQIEAVCTTYGNNTLAAVHENTQRMMELFGLDVPLLRGVEAPLALTDAQRGARPGSPSDAQPDEASFIVADRPRHAIDPASAQGAAPRFIADALTSQPGSLHILATGSTTNLGAAAVLRPEALGQATSITLMGGVTESLAINGRIMDELNLSCDPVATCAVLASGARLAIATSQNCLPAFFTRADLIGAFGEESWLYRTCDHWFRTMDAAYDWHGWTCWDVVAAAFLAHPELFCDHLEQVTLYERFIGVGYLECGNIGAPHAPVNLPTIRDAAAFKAHVVETWRRGLVRVDTQTP